MSWSVRAIGNVAEVRGCLDEQCCVTALTSALQLWTPHKLLQ